MATLNFFHLMTNFLYSSLLLILFSHFLEKSLALESHFGSTEISSLLPAPECCRHLTELDERQQLTLELFHTGPITNMPSAQDILRQDRLRVQSLQARSKSQFQDTKEVANLTVPYSHGLYAVNISLGTPPQELTLILDTAIDLTWTRCSSDPPINGLINFNPGASTSFLRIPCNNSICTQLLPNHSCDYNNYTCRYDINHADGLYDSVSISTDDLTITQTGDVFPGFPLGCSQNNHGKDFDNVAGMLGLGRDNVSFVEQTKQTYSGVFSYCFPSGPTLTGFLRLGPRDNYPSDLKFTPLSSDPLGHPSFYFIYVTSISVGNVTLKIDPSDLEQRRTVIDSGMVITRLSMNAYKIMRDEFQTQMTNAGYQVIEPGGDEELDTCYDIGVYFNINVPPISFTFKGNVTVNLNDSTALYAINSRLTCLAFAGNKNDDDLAIFGNTQQKTFEVVYDVSEEQLGFIPGGCY